ncbi:ABC transporter substrate-binding protein [Aquabacter cavernae]|uniref:ABC transporter substrate-binding protein n=1 Tax=Aquabacter cavernae TaxID=2496029 RepID=UPI000F8C6671|nr:ABC transporter substrate-binding protein [Aquabacter cavernae]
MKKIALSLVSALALASATPALAQSINIGHLADYSGGTSDVGQPYGQGVQDTIAYINKNGGVNGKQINSDFVEYGYQVPRALAAFKKWVGSEKVVAIQGWGTADTEALVGMVTKEEIPYYSGSYSASLTDPKGKVNEKSERAAPFNFFYGPSYSDAARAMVQWAADDWKAKGGQGKPKWVHMGANHPYPNSPKAAAEAYAKELGFDVLDPITFALTPGDYTAQCLTMKQSGANYAYLGNTAGSNISVLKACETAGVKVQFLGNVWGMGEEAMKAAGSAANGLVFPLRTAVTWTGNAPGLATFKDVSKMSDPSGNAYRTVHYMTAVCTVMYMKEAMEWADKNGGVTGVKIRDGMYQKTDWVPKGTEGVCVPSTWTTSDHRPTTTVELYRAVVKGPTDAPLADLVKSGTIALDKVATIQLPRKTELQGW